MESIGCLGTAAVSASSSSKLSSCLDPEGVDPGPRGNTIFCQKETHFLLSPDWAFVLSFIEKAVWHVWKQLPACPLLGESHKQTYDTSEGISGEEFFAPDASVSSEMSNKEFGSHAKKNVLFHSPHSLSKELPLKDHNIHSSHRGSSGRLNGKASGIKLCGHENNFGHQIDYFPKRKTFKNTDIFGFKHDEIISPIKLCRERKAFDAQDISGFSHSEIIYSKSKNKTHPWVSDCNISAESHLLSDQITKVDKHDHSLLVSDGERNLTSDSEWDRLKCNLNQNKTQAHTVPFLLRCSIGHDMLETEHFPAEIIQAASTVYSDHKNLGPVFEERESFTPCDRYLVDTYYSGESSDAPDNNPSKEQLDHFKSPFGSIMSCLDKTASNKLPTNLMQFRKYHELYSPEKTSILPTGDSRSIENTFTSQLGYSDEFRRFPNFFSSCFFMTDDWPDNVRSEGNYNSFVGLASRQCQTSELDMFEDNFQDGSREMVSIVDCKDDKLCISPVRMVHQNCSSHKIKFEKGAHAEINDRTAWLRSDFSNLKNRGGHSTQAVDLPVRECIDETPWEVFQHCQFSHSSNLRPRRSSSAPPFYKHKSKYYTIYDYSKTIKAKDQQAQNSDNGGTFAGSACTSKDLLGPFGTSPPFSKSVSDDPACELLDGTCVDKKASEIEINMVQTNEGSEKGASDMDYSNINMTKWRSGDLCPVQVKARTYHFDRYEDGILDIFSGVLHLAGGSFVPESISRDSFEDAKVLLQVDRKFILVVAGGILIAIDQHAADERIRLEDLRQKVMSGEGRSIHYFDVEQELLLPEIGLQLIQNYGEQIKRWGWICCSHVQCSGSFARNLNLLKQQSCRIDLLAVPCILGINLTDRDLLEYLEQLADTDGASTLPPSVIRVLNFKACRGAIMFGDPLLPSECSLILDELKKTALCFQCAHGRPTTAPLVNMVELHRHLAKLATSAESRSEVWHGLQQHIPSLERAQERLSSAERFRNG